MQFMCALPVQLESLQFLLEKAVDPILTTKFSKSGYNLLRTEQEKRG